MESYVRLAREHLDSMARNITDLADSNRSLTEPGETEYTFKGMVGITSVLFFTTVDATVTVDDGTGLKFSGRAWGPAVE
ncbi:MAG: hypothetical protein M3296_05390 [Actinomycetota bacterium]|nr:hypothetical protein [Actinomycetota bacterium]